jgi:hypothetical protein
MEIPIGTIIDVIKQYPDIGRKCTAEIAMYRHMGCSTPQLEACMIQTAAERDELTVVSGDQPIDGKRHFIIARMVDWNPQFSETPFVHYDWEAARSEQRRLANQHKCQGFGMYHLLSIFRRD